MFNKKGNIFTSNAVFVLSSMFGLGLITLLVINPVMHGYIAPSLLSTTTGSMNSMLTEKYNFVLSFVDILPYILFFIGIVYLIILIFRKERTDVYA